MVNLVKYTGVIFIVVGIIFSLTQISPLNELKEDVEYWEDAAKRNLSNNLIEQEYKLIKASYDAKLYLTVGSAISGIVIGIFFLALSTIITLLQKLLEKEKDILTSSSNITELSTNVNPL